MQVPQTQGPLPQWCQKAVSPPFHPHVLVSSTWVCCHLLGTSSTTGTDLKPPGSKARAISSPSESSPFVSPPRISLLPPQMLQLRRAGPPCQRVQAASAAQEMPLLPEHQPHGRQLPCQSSAVPQLSGKACLLPRGGGHAQLGPAPRNPGMMVGGREG